VSWWAAKADAGPRAPELLRNSHEPFHFGLEVVPTGCYRSSCLPGQLSSARRIDARSQHASLDERVSVASAEPTPSRLVAEPIGDLRIEVGAQSEPAVLDLNDTPVQPESWLANAKCIGGRGVDGVERNPRFDAVQRRPERIEPAMPDVGSDA
jgi:hypothetical protein